MNIIGNPIVAGASSPAASIFVTGLSETDTVTATKGSKTLTGKWAQKLNPSYHGLPDGYTELEYIESTGTQYIDTGVYLDANYLVELDAYLPDTNGSSFVVLFGADNNSNNRFIVASENGRMNAIFCSDSWTDYTQYTQNQRHKIVYDLSNTQSLSVDGVLFGTKTNAISTAIFPLALFALNRNNSIICQAKFRCYGFRISNGQSHLLNFIPAKRNSDGAIGMYDLVTSTFFGNAGTGAFTAGAEVPQTIDGFLIKPIRDFGTWTVTATDGTETYTQDVLVDVITVYEIEITKKLYLYRDGDECEDVTGGWTSGIYPSNGAAYWTTNNAISLDGYSKICFDVEFPTSSNTVNLGVGDISDSTGELSYCYSNRGTYTGVVEHSTDGIPDGSYLVRALITNTPFYPSTSITFSKNEDSLYIYYAWYTSAYVTTLTVKRIWLE